MKRPELTLTLSDLPDIVISEVLCRLPIKDAGRTSVLSRSWRYHWRFIPDLDIKDIWEPAVISHVLHLHHGPLRLFKAQSELRACSAIIPSWLSSLSHRSSSTLRSLFLGSVACNSGEPPVISLNTVASYFPNLTHLHLESCSFSLSPPSFKGFPHLRSLNIHHDLTSSPHLSFLISTCPLLEELILRGFYHDGIHDLDIFAPNLRLLKLLEPGSCRLSTSRVSLVETAVICLSDKFLRLNFNLLSVLGAMPSVRNLQLGYHTLELWARYTRKGEGCVPARVPISLNHLRSLSLEVHLESQTALLLCLLRSCPNLEELEIKRCPHVIYRIGEGFLEEQEQGSMLDQLKTVKVIRMEGVNHELELIRFLLLRAIRLKTMTISFGLTSRMEETARTKFLEFVRASTQAQILLIREKRT